MSFIKFIVEYGGAVHYEHCWVCSGAAKRLNAIGIVVLYYAYSEVNSGAVNVIPVQWCCARFI